MAALQEYKCPCCGGAIEFDSSIQKMKCPYCDTEFEMESLQAYDADLKNDIPDSMEWNVNPGDEWTDEDMSNIRSYVCKSCGGEIVGDATTAATACPYCGNPVVMMNQLSGSLKPDLVVPFKLDKNAAKRAYEQHISGKRLLPKVFKEQNHIEEIKGVYVPFWLFDAEADASIRYKATTVQTWSDSRYDYVKTNYYSVFRSGSLGFSAVPVDGSSKMADELMESIEPFHVEDAVDFQTAYLAGYFADKFDVQAEDCIQRANARIKRSTETAFAGTVQNYTSVVPESSSVRLNSGKAKYVLYPIWLLNTSWNGQKFTFAMNAQTGKLVGDLPLDKAAASSLKWKITAGVTAACLAISYLIWLL